MNPPLSRARILPVIFPDEARERVKTLVSSAVPRLETFSILRDSRFVVLRDDRGRVVDLKLQRGPGFREEIE